jgi:hypothetical protein
MVRGLSICEEPRSTVGARISHGACMQGALQAVVHPPPARPLSLQTTAKPSAQPAVATHPNTTLRKSRGLSLQVGVQTSAHHSSSC